MNRLLLKITVVLLFVLSACETYVSTKTLDREVLTFKHAGKRISIPVELQEIRTSRRRGGLFSGRRVAYTYAMVLISNGQELVQYPCEESASIDDFIASIKIRRSKDRNHFAIGKGNETFAIFHSFNKKHFVGYAALLNTDETHDFENLQLNAMPSSRSIILGHVSGDQILKTMDEKTLVDILCSVAPEDELNREAIYMLTDNRDSGLGRESEDRLIAYNQKSDNWRKTALSVLKDNKEDLETDDYVSKLYKLGGEQEVDKEDWKALQHFERDRDIDYFKVRLSMTAPKLSQKVSQQFREKLAKSVFNICSMSHNQQQEILESMELLREMGEKQVFERFLENYDKSGCKSETIHGINNSLMFISTLKPSEKRAWVDFMVRNFQSVPKGERDWDYDRIKDELTCSQQRNLLLKYKKDIDTFGDMEIPECN